LLALSSVACSGSPYRKTLANEFIDTINVSFNVPFKDWDIQRDFDKYKNDPRLFPTLHYSGNGVKYTISIQFLPFKVIPDHNLSNKDATYSLVLDDSQVEYSDIDREQGIGYKREWINYAQGMKCGEGVFSRSHGGLMSAITSKNYTLTCSYYNTAGEKQLISISYRYNYAGGSVRHENDQDTPREELLSLQQAELDLKQAVKRLVDTLNIKNMDRRRMEQEGLLHNNKTYEIYPY
jgi:hypothetical protein